MTRLFLSLMLLGFMTSFVFAASSSEEQTKAVMGNIYDSYVKIIPYVYSSKNIFDDLKIKKNKEELLNNLSELSLFLKSAKHAEFLQRPGFKPSLETILDHLEETIISVESNSFIFAQKRLNVIGALCVTCHAQLPDSVSKNTFGNNIKQEKRERFDSDFSYANYLYLVRRFEESKKHFNKFIEDSLTLTPKNESQEIINSLRKIISIDTKIKFNFEKANNSIQKWEKEPRFSLNIKKMIKRWGTSLKTWKGFNPSAIKAIGGFIEINLSPLDLKKEIIFTGEEDITLLISSGVLFNFLIENPNSEYAPEILYWLSLAEHRMGSSYFFSLGDLYLKDCIRKYPASPYAKKCYLEYADSIEASFSGSGGTDIPLKEKKELLKLKNLLKP